MKRTIMTTGDGSKTIHMPDLNEQYHSTHGALQEALHVFINMGLGPIVELKSQHVGNGSPIRILEYGFGTGLNAMLTLQYPSNLKVVYTGLEAFPVTAEEVTAMDYGILLNDEERYHQIHQVSWEEHHEITPKFSLIKKQTKFEMMEDLERHDLIYFDAFGPRTQPELWTLEIFIQAFNALKSGGVLVTYCAQGQARRNMQEAGFQIERLPGPPGKREMLRATKRAPM
jgi:tRNA U34 5-methylaminomethyl-2-thiouridine-forming methyltransferase MnmC